MKQPLLYIFTAIIAAAFITTAENYILNLSLIACFAAAALFCALLPRKNCYTAAIILFSLSFALSASFFQLRIYRVDRLLLPCIGKKVTVSGRVTEVQGHTYSVRLDDINGSAPDFNCNIMLYGNYDFSLAADDLITVRGTLRTFALPRFEGDFDSSLYCKAKSCYGAITADETEIIGKRTGLFTVGRKIRASITRSIDKHLSGDEAALLKSITIGDREDLSCDLYNRLSLSNLTHITVVSGLHVSIFLGMFSFVIAGLRRKRTLKILIIAAVSGLIIIVIGPTPSVLRAVIMAVYCIIVVSLSRRYDPIAALCFSAAVVCLLNPYSVHSASFVLSYLCTLALLIPTINSEPHESSASASLFVMSAPACAYYFNTVSFAMFVTNLLAAPVIALLLPLGFLMNILPFLRLPVKLLCRAIIIICRAFSELDFLRFYVKTPSDFAVIFLCLAVAACYTLIIFGKRRLTAVILAVSLAFGYADYRQSMYLAGTKTVTVFDSDGSCMHIKTLNGKNIFISGKYTEDILTYMTKQGIRRADLMLFTSNKALAFELPEKLVTGKICVPYVPGERLKQDRAVKYCENCTVSLDGVSITDSRYDEKTSYTVKIDGKTFLFEPLDFEKCDVAVLKKKNGSYIPNGEIVVGKGLQSGGNMLYSYYDTVQNGSVTFIIKDNTMKIKTLR